MSAISFEILKKDKETNARIGLIRTRNGDIQTPYLVPVATMATVRALGSDDLICLGVQCSLANTYHLHLEPGDDLIARMGGLHRFMGFNRPIFTDSGGFQAFSMGFAREHNISKIGNIFPQELSNREPSVKDPSVKELSVKDLSYKEPSYKELSYKELSYKEPSYKELSYKELSARDPLYKDQLTGYRSAQKAQFEEQAIDCIADAEGCSRNSDFREHGKAKPSPIKKENLTRISDDGISFKSRKDGIWHFLNAEKSMKIQSNLDSDIIMAFDECTSPLNDYDYTRKAMLRTHVWAEESIRYHNRNQALYGIIQGGWFEDLRRESTDAILSQPFDGIAIGGSLGNSKQDMHQVLDWTVPRLDDGRPRHLLGIGDIDDLLECVARGIDTFDCVAPTRMARRGSLLLSPEAGGSQDNKFRINIKSSKFKEDQQPIDPNCTCPTCRTYSRAYLRHLYVSRELSYFRLATLHNLHFMLRFMDEIRESIRSGGFLQLKKRWLK